MSPIAKHIAEHIQTVVENARPGLCRVYVVVAEYTDGSETTHLMQPEPQDRREEAAPGRSINEMPSSIEGAQSSEEIPTRRDGESPISCVQRLRRERGRVELKARQWAPIADISVNEIERAMEQGAIPHRAKPNGRGHGAKIISAEAMLRYLTEIAAVERGDIPQPAWWPAVRAVGNKAA